MRNIATPGTVKRLASAVSMFSTTVPLARRAKVLTEAQPLLSAQAKCKEIWGALQLADYKKEGTLNDAAIAVLYESQRVLFQELLLVRSPEELQELLDHDEDGFLDPDEQLAIFSLIKERMQLCAEELCACHEYALFKEMMQEVRKVETDVVEYQEILRMRVQQKELEAYNQSGEHKLRQFKAHWKQQFSSFHSDSQSKLSALKSSHSLQTREFTQQLKRDVSILHHKPRALLRDLQTQEVMVAVNERYNEAQKIRNELTTLEEEEQRRVEKKVMQEWKMKKEKLKKKQEKEIRELMGKTETAMNGLKITRDQQLNRLQKEIKLYLNDIHRNHNSSLRFARRLGETRDELRRTKKKANIIKQLVSDMHSFSKTNKSLLLAESTLTAGVGHGSVISLMPGRAKTSSPLKRGMREITRFDITGEKAPSRGAYALLRKQLIPALKAAEGAHVRSVSALYDTHLTPVHDSSLSEALLPT